MKTHDFSSFLKEIADLAAILDSRAHADQLQELSAALRSMGPTVTIAALCKSLASLQVDQSLNDRAATSFVPVLRQLELILETAGKKSYLNDTKALRESLEKHPNSNFSDLIQAAQSQKRKSPRSKKLDLRSEDIRRFASRLEEALGDQPGFEKTFADLKSSDLTAAELKAVSKQFAGKAGSSKTSALNAIWNRHQSLMNARAKARATGNRTAA